MTTSPDAPTKDTPNKMSFLRLYGASLITMLLAAFAVIVVAVVIMMITFAAAGSGGSDPLQDLVIGIFLIALPVTILTWLAVTLFAGRLFVRLLTDQVMKYWQLAVAFVPVAVVAWVISALVPGGDSGLAAVVWLLAFFGVVPSISALILRALGKDSIL